MKAIRRFLLLYIGVMVPQLGMAQIISIDDCAAVRVYDAWEQSPFRMGQLQGNAAVVDGVWALQRSRFGSNTFGLRIDLREPFRLTKTPRYLHVMAWLADKPAPSRMMVIGLGRRVEDEWAWQTGEDEQFWALSSSDIAPSDSWQDVVFSFKGFSYSLDENAESGIDIHSLVIVPDVRSPHADTADFACYFDQITIDESPALRFATDQPAGQDDEADWQPEPSANDIVRVSDQQLNGAVLAADGRALNRLEAPAGQSFTIRMSPAPGFSYSGVRVRYGSHLDGPPVVNGRRHYRTMEFTASDFDANDCLTLPATIMHGTDVRIEGIYIQGGKKSVR